MSLHKNARSCLKSRGLMLKRVLEVRHPAEIMDTSFALQALSTRYLVERHDELKPGVFAVPDEIDGQVAQMKLASMQISIDTLTEEQKAHLTGWE